MVGLRIVAMSTRVRLFSIPIRFVQATASCNRLCRKDLEGWICLPRLRVMRPGRCCSALPKSTRSHLRQIQLPSVSPHDPGCFCGWMANVGARIRGLCEAVGLVWLVIPNRSRQAEAG